MTTAIPQQRNQLVLCANCDTVLDDRVANPDVVTNMLADCSRCLKADIDAIVRQELDIEAASDE